MHVNTSPSAGMQKITSESNLSNELRDTFYSNSKKNSVFHVCLNVNGLLLQRSTSNGFTKDHTVKMSDIIGGRCVRLQTSVQHNSRGSCGACTPGMAVNNLSCDKNEDAYLYVFAYILKKSRRNMLRRERTVITLRFRSFDSHDDNMREAERWYIALKAHRKSYLVHSGRIIRNSSIPSRRLLVLLNPKSGSGKARELFHQHVVPVLNEAEVPYDIYVTKHSQYAFDFVRCRDLSTWNGIVAVGGDGIFHEILNGLLKRRDWEDVIQNISLGVVPCGTGNGLARSIAHSYNEPYDPKPILGAALTLVSGHSTSIDVVEVEINKKIVYSFLSIGWGLISDIDIESERLRPLGYQRFTIWTLHRLLSLRTYQGKISYIPKVAEKESPSSPEDPSVANKKLHQSLSCNALSDVAAGTWDNSGGTDFDDVISLETVANHSLRSRCGSWLSSGSRKSTYYSIAESLYQSISDSSETYIAGQEENADVLNEAAYVRLGQKRSASTSDAWVDENGEFVMIHAAYQTHIGSECHFSPQSKLNDGTIHLVIIRGGISRSRLLTFLINMSSGTHLPNENTEFIKVVRVQAFRLEPFENSGILTIDGERVICGTLQAKVIPAAVNIMIPKSDALC